MKSYSSTNIVAVMSYTVRNSFCSMLMFRVDVDLEMVIVLYVLRASRDDIYQDFKE